MDDKCGKTWHPWQPCRPGELLPLSTPSDCSTSEPHPFHPDATNPGGIRFGPGAHQDAGILIPGYNVPALPLKPVRDPSLSLVAWSGVDPTDPVMVEVPAVQNNSSFAPTRALAGWRIGFAGRYVRENEHEPVEYTSSFLRALEALRHAGAQLIQVDAQTADETLWFSLKACNPVDDLASRHRLDALVSEGQSAAFGHAGSGASADSCVSIEGGTTLCFYAPRWAGKRLLVLMYCVRQVLQEKSMLLPTSRGE